MGNANPNTGGNGCVSALETGTNNPMDDKQFANLTLGETYVHDGYCEYAGSGNANCGSSEFIPAGDAGIGCRCRGLCNDGCQRKLCKRVAFNGDATECCYSGRTSLGTGMTCDPKYRNYDTDACNIPMMTYCANGTNLFDNSNCRVWANKQNADAVILEVCRRPENKDRSECSCVMAVDEFRSKYKSGTKVPASCIDNRCTNNNDALKTTDMRAPCNLVNCEMNIEDVKAIISAPNSTYNASFVQNCQQNANAPVVPKTDVPKTDVLKSDYTSLFVVGGVSAVVFVLMIIIVIVILSMQNNG